MAESKNEESMIPNFSETEREHATLEISSEEENQKIPSSKSHRKNNKRVNFSDDLILTLIRFFL